MPNITHTFIAALGLSVFMFLAAMAWFPNFYLAWIAVGLWGAAFYTLHEEITLGGNAGKATPIVLVAGAIVAGAFSLMGAVYGLMAASAVVLVILMRRILPQHFPLEHALEEQRVRAGR